MEFILFFLLAAQASTLKLWALTRWDSRWQSIDSIIRNYPAVIQALQDLSEEGTGARSVNAAGLLLHLRKSIFIVSSFILEKLLGIIKILSDQLKSKSFSLSFGAFNSFFFFWNLFEGPSLDYARGEYLISSVIQQISDLKNEKSFADIYSRATEFCKSNNIDLVAQYTPRRTTTAPARFKEFIVNETLGHRDTLSTQLDFREKIYYPLIGCILVELKDRFSSKTLSLLKSLSTVYPESENFLNINDIQSFSDHIDGDLNATKNEFMVIKPMIKNKPITNVIEFLNELLPMAGAFPNTIRMIKAAVTMPISQVTCERSFSKMKLIKTYARNSMNDDRLSDLTILAIERAFEIDFENVIDVFANNHKNSRIMLR